jgi:hypothetical protein
MTEEFNEEFNVDAFINQLKKDKSKEAPSGNTLNKVFMNRKNYQGNVTFIPFISKSIGNIYTKLEGVREWYDTTSVLEGGEAWYRILPIKFYKGITPEQIELYNEVVSLFDACNETGKYGYEGLGQDAILKVRNFSLFTGICTAHVDTEGGKVEDNIDKPCLFCFPSNSPIDALESYISGLADTYGNKVKNYIQKFITPANKGRQGVIQIAFRKSASPGYASSVTFLKNDEFKIHVDPDKEFPAEIVSLFDDPISKFLGWMYDYDNKTYFNETVFVELRNNLKAALIDEPESTEESKGENKNGNQDPMAKPPIPSVDAPEENKEQPKEQPKGFKPPF